MIDVDRAIRHIERATTKLAAERVTLEAALGRFLAEDIVADSDMPPFDRSQMDGYACRAADVVQAPISLKVVGESAAGKGWSGQLSKGEAVRIMTGAPLPAGADCVQKVELAEEANGHVTIAERVGKGKYVVKRGEEIKAGKKVLKPGERLDERSLAVAAAFGYSKVRVGKRPRVAILATGSEIVPVGKKPKPDQIRNSNSAMLKAFAESAGGVAEMLPIAGDDREKLVASIKDGLKRSDILVITGGVSVGKYDLTKDALESLGAKIIFDRVRLKPGKPTVLATHGKKLIFGLPGNPVSAAVTFFLFVRRAVVMMQGASVASPKAGTAIAADDLKGINSRDFYLPVALEHDDDGRWVAKPTRWIGSSDLVGFSRADALLFIPQGSSYRAGETAPILYLR